jgi:hypothetical protein
MNKYSSFEWKWEDTREAKALKSMVKQVRNPLGGKNVSFDYDDTLSKPEVVEYALKLKEQGYNIWITTARYPEDYKGNLFAGQIIDNSEVFSVADKIGIPRNQINFLSFEPKRKFFIQNPNFLVHLDDNFFREVHDMNGSEECLVPAVWYNHDYSKWQEKMSEYL